MANNIPMKDSALNVIASKRAAQEAGTKSIDPKITKTTTTNPEMGTTTTRTSWSGSSSSAKPASKNVTKPTTPVKRTVTTPSRTNTPSRTVTPTSGSREITTFNAPKAAGVVTQKITAPLINNSKKFVPTTTKEKRIAKQVETYNKYKKPDESFEGYKTRRTSETQEAIKKGPAKKEKWSGVGGRDASKNKSGTCMSCG